MSLKKQQNPETLVDATDPPSFADLLSFRLHLLSKLVDQHAEASHRSESGLSLMECRVIGVAGAQGPVSFKALCELAELEKSGASRLVARLIEQGLIERLDDPTDARSFLVRTTPAGRRLRQQIHRSAQARNERWLAVLSPTQRRTFSSCLALLHEQARAMLDEGDAPAARAKAGAVRAPEADEPSRRIAWIDRQVADQLYALLGAALQKPDAPARQPETSP